jgi:AcrR family transcriptional regulator
LHYYFGTKEQLLVEAVRRDCELRLEALERRLTGAQSARDFIDLMAQDLQETLREDPEFVTLLFELFTLARRNADIAVEYAQLMRRTRERVASLLAKACCTCTPSRRPSPRSCSRSPTASRCGCSASPIATSAPRWAPGSPARERCWPISAKHSRL